MKITDAGLKTDLQNANEGTQRGRGLLEKSLRQLGAGRSILMMNGVMAGFAQSNAIRWFVSCIWVIRPILDMVRFKLSTTFTALLANVIALFQNKFMPLLVFVSAIFNGARCFISLIGGMVFSTLKMRRAFPCAGVRTSFNTIHAENPRLRIAPRGDHKPSNGFVSIFGLISARLGAIFSKVTWAASKFVSALCACFYYWRIKTFRRAVQSLSFFVHTWGYFKKLTTPQTYFTNSFSGVSSPNFITAFQGTGFTTSMIEIRWFGVKEIATVFANCLNSCFQQYPLMSR